MTEIEKDQRKREGEKDRKIDAREVVGSSERNIDGERKTYLM